MRGVDEKGSCEGIDFPVTTLATSIDHTRHFHRPHSPLATSRFATSIDHTRHLLQAASPLATTWLYMAPNLTAPVTNVAIMAEHTENVIWVGASSSTSGSSHLRACVVEGTR
jgi:acyl-CoA thioesterase